MATVSFKFATYTRSKFSVLETKYLAYSNQFGHFSSKGIFGLEGAVGAGKGGGEGQNKVSQNKCDRKIICSTYYFISKAIALIKCCAKTLV